MLSALLVYLWENRDKEVSEYAIAVEALGRKPDFESKIDATVRVQISRLRRLLGKYYEAEGAQLSLKLEIPLGTHKIRLIEGSSDVERESYTAGVAHLVEEPRGLAPIPIAPVAGQRTAPNRFLVPVMAGANILLLCLIALLVRQVWHRGNPAPAAGRQQLPVFWKSFSDNGRSVRLVLPAPIFFTWPLPNGSSFFARDISVNEFSNDKNSEMITGLEKRMGKPNHWQGYTVLPDTFAALRLVRFFDSYGIRASISTSDQSPQGIIEQENIVTFGTTTSLGIYQAEIDRLGYQLGPHEQYVVDKRLPPGSPVLFHQQVESGSRSVVPGLVAFLPRGNSGSRILILEGPQTTALVAWLTSEDGLRELAEAEAAQDKGPYFEAVVLCEVNGENPFQSRMVAFRPVTANER